MADRENTLRNSIKTVTELKGKKRLAFVWGYYKAHIITAAVLLVALFSVLNLIFFNPKPKSILTVSFYGATVSDESCLSLSEALNVSLLKEGEAGRHTVKAHSYLSDIDNTYKASREMDMFLAYFFMKEHDIIIFDMERFDELASQEGLFLECGEYLTQTQIERLSGSLMAAGEDEKTRCVMIGADNAYLKRFGIDPENLVLAVFSNSGRIDRVREAVPIILSE